MTTAIEQAEQAQATITELEARAVGLRQQLAVPADLSSGDFRKAALVRLQAREELTAVEQELSSSRQVFNRVHLAAEGERQRLRQQESRRLRAWAALNSAGELFNSPRTMPDQRRTVPSDPVEAWAWELRRSAAFLRETGQSGVPDEIVIRITL